MGSVFDEFDFVFYKDHNNIDNNENFRFLKFDRVRLKIQCNRAQNERICFLSFSYTIHYVMIHLINLTTIRNNKKINYYCL